MSDEATNTLIVEDDRANRDALVRLLQYSGLLVDSASTVAEAIRKLSPPPKLVLLDIQLPDGSGAQVLHAIRSQNLPTTVAILTGSDQLEHLEDLRLSGADAIFTKPYMIDDLLGWVTSTYQAGETQNSVRQ